MGPGDSTHLIPDDDAGDVLLAHSFQGPLSLTTPTKEAVVCLGLDSSGLHPFGQTVGGGQYEGFSAAEELNCSCCFPASSSMHHSGNSTCGE